MPWICGQTPVRFGLEHNSRRWTVLPQPRPPAFRMRKSKSTPHILGGGFGRRATPQSDFVVEAVYVAKAAGVPVKAVWTREDDMQGGWYRPAFLHAIVGGVDASGNPVSWRSRLVGQSIMSGTMFEAMMMKGKAYDPASVEGVDDLPYEIPNLSVESHQAQVGVPVQWWRSVGHSHTGFATECFIDELAALGSKDPYEFRRALLTKHPRHLAVLDLAAQKAGWGKPLPKGRGAGYCSALCIWEL